MRFNSIRFKTSILYTAILGVILALYSSILFYAVNSILYRDLDESLQVKAHEVADIIHAYEQAEKIENHPLSFLAEFFKDERMVSNKRVIDDLWYSQVKTLNLKNDYIHIITSTGRLILSSENVKEEEGTLFVKQFPFNTEKIVFKNLKDQKHHLRAINFPVVYNDRPQIIVQIATPLSSILKTLSELTVFIILTVGFILLLTSFMGGVFAKGVLTPVRHIAEAANNISHKDLHVRVEEKESDEEISYLVKSFNTMLSRLQKSFGHINEFSSHVAHELKTPLAILRGEMELALSENQSKEELRKVLETGMEEVNRVIRITKDLLLLANLDYRTDIFKFEKIGLIDFIKDICENGKILAKEKNIEVYAVFPQDELFVEGDKIHLRRLFFNLLHNAIKFTPTGGKIHIELANRGTQAAISVTDNGIGMTPDDVSKLFTKFFRAAPKEEKTSDAGNGLGLSIAKSIAQAHQGEISVQSIIEKGSTFTVILPLI